jgi:hypothetical protein
MQNCSINHEIGLLCGEPGSRVRSTRGGVHQIAPGHRFVDQRRSARRECRRHGWLTGVQPRARSGGSFLMGSSPSRPMEKGDPH